jgi:hypothetical protein
LCVREDVQVYETDLTNRTDMRFGRIAAVLLGVGLLCIFALILLQPG